jgi:hypothetical protein
MRQRKRYSEDFKREAARLPGVAQRILCTFDLAVVRGLTLRRWRGVA